MKQFIEKNEILIQISAFVPGAALAYLIGSVIGVPNNIIVAIQIPLFGWQLFCILVNITVMNR